ncbi:cbb3-type cytochrome c oxidase subunit 3 [uncultured Jannaschia sp.]|uniref:cbb3-type cytochrome c oxidase subunit 3 n=1 Tax=uncultured Jannaschia sp. TaxID=293347 RepID=UPI00261E73C9|nr:cbb3-type cytochrome c oxidase subunit 3 [uncultured Jannaschia sp.]
MELTYEGTSAFAKSFGLIYLMVLSLGITVYAFWPSLGKRFDRAAKSVLDDEEGPCR